MCMHKYEIRDVKTGIGRGRVNLHQRRRARGASDRLRRAGSLTFDGPWKSAVDAVDAVIAGRQRDSR